MIRFAAYTAAETPSAFQWARQLPKIAPSLPVGISPPCNTWFIGPIQVSISITSAVFAELTNVTNRQTDTRTDHAIPSVEVGCDAAKNSTFGLAVDNA